MTSQSSRIVLFTAIALTAFAANSVLNRLALGANAIDAGSYIAIRLGSGALTLWLINAITKRQWGIILRGSPMSAFYLFLYGVAFSYAYRSLSAGTGAFILFGTVQTTMLTVLLMRGERPHVSEWLGLFIAFSGLVYLVFPGLSAPDPLGAAMMGIAGVAWGFYTLRGKGIKDPLETTAQNFLLSVPMVACVLVFTYSRVHVSAEGVGYALLSGALASGVGYVVWYEALKGLTNTQAALLQLTVPVIAALGGVLFLAEHISVRLIVSGLLIVSGVSLALVGKQYVKRMEASNNIK